MLTLDIVRQLAMTLPLSTDMFSDSVNIISLVRSGTTATATTQVDHGLQTGSSIVIDGALTPTSITSITSSGTTATAITATATDLTEGWENGMPSDSPMVEITGSNNPAYNGRHPLLSVPNRKTFTYQIDSEQDPSTGTTLLLEDKLSGFNGTYEITVVDSTTFTYEVATAPSSPAQGMPLAHKGIRVFGAADINEAISAYTAQSSNTDLWACVVLGNVSAITDPNAITGVTANYANGIDFTQKINTPFHVLVFVTGPDNVYGRISRDQMEQIRPYILRSLIGKKFDTELTNSTSTGCIYEGDATHTIEGALYIHQLTFSSVSEITLADGIQDTDSVAFRDIALSHLDVVDGTIEMVSDIDLDDQPAS